MWTDGQADMDIPICIYVMQRIHKNVKPYIAKYTPKMVVFCILLYVNGEE
jgi:hypothetical protein